MPFLTGRWWVTLNYWLVSSNHVGTISFTLSSPVASGSSRLYRCIKGDRESDPLHFAEIGALHRNQPITTTMCHRQCGVNLVWRCRQNGGSANPVITTL